MWSQHPLKALVNNSSLKVHGHRIPLQHKINLVDLTGICWAVISTDDLLLIPVLLLVSSYMQCDLQLSHKMCNMVIVAVSIDITKQLPINSNNLK